MSQVTQTAEQLAEKLLAEKEAEIASLKGTIEQQQQQLTEKEKVLFETQQQLAAKTAEVSEAEGLIAGLQTSLASQESAESSLETIVSHKGKKYRVTAPSFKFKTVEYNAADLVDNKDVLAVLVEKKSSLLAAL